MSGAAGRLVPPIGNQGNAWNAAATGAGGNSNAVQVYDSPWVSVFGHVDGATTLTVCYSHDGVTWYASGNKATTTGAGDFSIDFTTAAQWIRLQSSANVTATATVAAKDG